MPAMGITASATLGRTWNAKSRSADLQRLNRSDEAEIRLQSLSAFGPMLANSADPTGKACFP